MLRYAIGFLIIALLAAFMGFGDVEYSWEGAKILFVIFLVLALVILLLDASQRHSSWK